MNKTSAWLLGTAAAVTLTAAAFLLWFGTGQDSSDRFDPAPRRAARPSASETAPPAVVAPAPDTTAPGQPLVISGLGANVSGVGTRPAAGVVVVSESAKRPTLTVRPGQVLATVNDVPLRLQDLMPLEPDTLAEREFTFDAEELQARLNSAIERELIAQSAEAWDVALTAHQRERLEEVYQRMLEKMNVGGEVEWSSVSLAQLEFQQRVLTAILLQENLLRQVAGLPRYPTTEMVWEHYREHILSYGVLPDNPQQAEALWKEFDQRIRRSLAPVLEQQYKDWVRQYLDVLKSEYNIQIAIQLPS
jgi:hypothetical protein